jgi:hypothetical protein
MKEQRTIEGRWWIFGTDKPEHFGVLNYNPESGLSLKVTIAHSFSFKEVFSDLHSRNEFPEIIQGRDSHDKPVTLFGCACSGSHISGGLASYDFSPLAALLGQSIPSWESAVYRSVQFHFTLLHNWVDVSCIKIAPTDAGALQVQLLPRDDIKITLPCGAQLTLTPEFGTESKRGDFHITEGHNILIEFPKLVHVQTIRDSYSHLLRRLLTLFTGTLVFEERVKVQIPDSDNPPSDAELLLSNEGASEAKTDLHSGRMTVPHAEIAANFPAILRRWFEYHQKLDSALDLYFATVFNRNLYINQRFLFLAQALEVYHNSNPEFVGYVQPTPDFRARRERIVEGAPEVEREWLREKLHYANQKTLAERLADILEKHKAEAEQFIPDLQRFADKVRHTRNYYTHFDEKLRENGRIAEGNELVNLVFQMRTLMGICVLKDLGIAGAPIARLINKLKGMRLVSLDNRPSRN